MRYAVVMQETY